GRGVVVLGHLGLLAPGGDPQPVELAGGFQQLGHGDVLRQAVAAEGGVVGVEGDAEHEVGAGIGADAVDDLDDHPHAVLQAAAVLVGTLVVEGGGEALHAGAAANGELKAVGPGLLGVHGGDDMGFRQLLDFADGHRARLGIAQHGVGCDTGGHSLVEIRLHPYSLDEGPGTPFVGRLDDFLDGVEVVPAVGANEPARRYQRGRLNLTAGDPHEADAALGAGLEIADLLLGADTETHHAVGGHEDSILDVEIADLHRIEEVFIVAHGLSSKALWCNGRLRTLASWAAPWARRHVPTPVFVVLAAWLGTAHSLSGCAVQREKSVLPGDSGFF